MTAATSLVARWAHVYGDSKALSAAITYAHLAGILVAGGLAVATDRASLLLARDAESDVARELARLATVHRFVLSGLAVTASSGVLMLLADLHTYLTSVLFWTKMLLVLTLLANGWLRLRAERALLDGVDTSWRRFRRTSVASVVLWFSILLAGAFLTTIS
jgi:hypothetical protein